MHSMRPWPKLVHSVYLLNRRGLSCVCARIVTSRGFWPIVSSVTRLLGCLTIVCSAWEGLAIELGRYYIMNTLIYYNNIKRIAKTVTQYLSHLLSWETGLMRALFRTTWAASLDFTWATCFHESYSFFFFNNIWHTVHHRCAYTWILWFPIPLLLPRFSILFV